MSVITDKGSRYQWTDTHIGSVVNQVYHNKLNTEKE